MLRYFLKNSLAFLFYLLGGLYILKIIIGRRNVLIVLMYHNFNEFHNFSIRRGSILRTGYGKNFERQVRFLNENFHFSYPDEFFNNRQNEKNITGVLITFDDGYKDNFSIAYPILLKYNAKSIFFIPTNHIGSEKWLWHDKVYYLISEKMIDFMEGMKVLEKMNKGEKVPVNFLAKVESHFKNSQSHNLLMTWEELEILSKKGFKIGSHTANHQILSFTDAKTQEEEIKRSVMDIHDKLGIHCKYLAYPNGLYNDSSLRLLDKYNIDFGFTTLSGINDYNEDKLQIKRIGMNASDSVYLMLLKLFINTIR